MNRTSREEAGQALASHARLPSRAAPRGAVLTALSLLPTLALAQLTPPVRDPWYIGINQAFTGDSNVFRAQSGPGDRISSTSLLGGIDVNAGRGRVAADLTWTANRFQYQDQLDNNERNLRGVWEWATIERISGDVRVYDRSSLDRYDLETPEGRTTRDMLTNRGIAAGVRVGVVTRWTFEAGAAYDQSEHSDETQQNRDLRQASVNLGMRYRPSDLWSVRFGVRRSEGRYPDYGIDPVTGESVEDKFDRNDFDLSGTWTPTANSSLNARLSFTNEDHSFQSQRDVNTWTGALGYNWRITGKTSLGLQLVRDTNTGSSNIDYGLVSDYSSDTRIRNSINLTALWEATAKISVQGNLGYSRRKLDNAFTLNIEGGEPYSDVSSAHDRTYNGGVKVTYQYNRGLSFGCSINREVRSVSGETTGVTYPYNVTWGGCNAQYVLR